LALDTSGHLPGAGVLEMLAALPPNVLLLVAGDKSGNWQRWYEHAIPLAEARYAEHLAALSDGAD
jgi:hypothetical protein